VQQNAASAEQSASASREMKGQADRMKGFVGELVDLVEGRRNGAGGALEKDLLPQRRIDHPALGPAHLPGKGVHGGQKAPAAAAKTEKKMAAVVSKPKAARPDQLIPLEEGDFKEF
jgi:hypothetical protein